MHLIRDNARAKKMRDSGETKLPTDHLTVELANKFWLALGALLI